MEQPFSSHDKLILFDLVKFDLKQLSPTGSQGNADLLENSVIASEAKGDTSPSRGSLQQ